MLPPVKPGDPREVSDAELEAKLGRALARRVKLRLDEDVFEKREQVGEGTYGKVYKAIDRSTGDMVALKKIRMETEREGFPFTSLREIKLLMQLRHPNVVAVREIMSRRPPGYYLVFDYHDHDLAGLIAHPSVRFPESQLKCLVRQLLLGLRFLHERGVLHRDIKGSNLLVSASGVLKLADFGLARDLTAQGRRGEGDYTNRVITLWYRPPELLWGSTKYGSEVDMWSAGCIILELYLRTAAFQGTDEISQLRAIWRILGTPIENDRAALEDLQWFKFAQPKEPYKRTLEEVAAAHNIPESALDLISKLLAYDPAQRPSAVEALAHTWFSEEPLPCPEGNHIPINVEGDWHEYDAKLRRKGRRNAGAEEQGTTGAPTSVVVGQGQQFQGEMPAGVGGTEGVVLAGATSFESLPNGDAGDGRLESPVKMVPGMNGAVEGPQVERKAVGARILTEPKDKMDEDAMDVETRLEKGYDEVVGRILDAHEVRRSDSGKFR
ncbi:Pkinase-domain-containing protein [Gonapodya prolifera JEL478]|uniref:cyclin-dependent kinase n=1 Tax=Gonapodya prolifera (strain JEL478) TaxID=1344416 RepID=A0A139AUY1_GONPJ|nr:Pkinase-domain-containing protein [Gonapodya prolifera JEL478]|eukprot:KXS20528.1 Pkinase-domain-containing protein [Gonapodya prolifera JEL478]